MILLKYTRIKISSNAFKNNDLDITRYNIPTTPLYFVRSGNIAISYGRSRNMGISGYYWTITASLKLNSNPLTPSAYYLSFGDAVSTSNGPREYWYGYPLRCLKLTKRG